MKKVVLLGLTVLFSIGIVGLNSCRDDVKDAFGCVTLANELAIAYANYDAENPTTASCQDYKDAIQAYINDCDDVLQTEVDDYQVILDALNCDL